MRVEREKTDGRQIEEPTKTLFNYFGKLKNWVGGLKLKKIKGPFQWSFFFIIILTILLINRYFKQAFLN